MRYNQAMAEFNLFVSTPVSVKGSLPMALKPETVEKIKAVIAENEPHLMGGGVSSITPAQIAAILQLLETLLPVIISIFGGTIPTPTPTTPTT